MLEMSQMVHNHLLGSSLRFFTMMHLFVRNQLLKVAVFKFPLEASTKVRGGVPAYV